MSQPNLDRLRSIKTLPSLVAYLRDELDWPLESDDIEDISFDYTSAELGLAAAAVRIKEIKQLRPLHGNQPWGIFWVNFEKKQLPVVVMRLILRALVLKKRASSGQAERQAWAANDLLFISAYGEETGRASPPNKQTPRPMPTRLPGIFPMECRASVNFIDSPRQDISLRFVRS